MNESQERCGGSGWQCGGRWLRHHRDNRGWAALVVVHLVAVEANLQVPAVVRKVTHGGTRGPQADAERVVLRGELVQVQGGDLEHLGWREGVKPREAGGRVTIEDDVAD